MQSIESEPVGRRDILYGVGEAIDVARIDLPARDRTKIRGWWSVRAPGGLETIQGNIGPITISGMDSDSRR